VRTTAETDIDIAGKHWFAHAWRKARTWGQHDQQL